MLKKELLTEFRCPCCLKNGFVMHEWVSSGEDSGERTSRHRLVCSNCGRASLPMDTAYLAIETFLYSFNTCWYADADTVLISLERLNELIASGKPVTKKQLDRLDLRSRLG